MRAALENKRFRIDPQTLQIVMEGEEGFQYAESPAARATFGQNISGLGRRFSVALGRGGRTKDVSPAV